MTSMAPAAELTRTVELAVTAPSIHNSQPWRWSVREDGLRLFADRSRWLPVIDPDSHALVLSCGAALYLAELALRAAGWTVRVDRLPDPADDDLLATITLTGRAAPAPELAGLVAAARRRHTERRPFAQGTLPADTVEALRAAGTGDGVWTHVPHRPEELLDLAVAVSRADRDETTDPDYRAELAAWTRADADADDGVPAGAVPHLPGPRHSDIPPRDFEVGAAGRQVLNGAQAEQVERPVIAVVCTDDDSRRAWLRAGEALCQLLVAAEDLGVAAAPLTQVTDWPVWRSRLRGLMEWPGYPQTVVRLGLPPAGPAAPHAGRRGTDEVID
jgi:hypothetical protein